MLTQDQINNNRDEFLKLLSQIDVPDADTQGLADFLLESDFFTAPASTQYHCNYEGGLCYHSLNVYYTLVDLIEKYAPGMYDNNTLLITALLHDISKTNFYEKYVVNKKVYSDVGSKKDNLGKFDWIAEDAYRVKDATERFLGGEHGFNSMMIANKYIPLSYPEVLAIVHHHGGLGEAKQISDLSAIYNKYPIVVLLHTADFLSTFIKEAIPSSSSPKPAAPIL